MSMNAFCPNCEKETRCTHTAELYECELRARLNACESALVSMVRQFFYSPENGNVFSHAFMSAEEEAAAYLVGVGIAFWNDEGHSAICFEEVKE